MNIPPIGTLSFSLRSCGRLAYALLHRGGYGDHVNAVIEDLKEHVRRRVEEVERKESLQTGRVQVRRFTRTRVKKKHTHNENAMVCEPTPTPPRTTPPSRKTRYKPVQKQQRF